MAVARGVVWFVVTGVVWLDLECGVAIWLPIVFCRLLLVVGGVECLVVVAWVWFYVFDYPVGIP